MGVWADFVDLVYTTLVGLSMIFGGNMGLAIGVLSLSFRLALLPLTLWLAQRSLEVQASLKKLEPELSNIRRKHKDDPRRIWKETANLHQQHGIKVLEGKSLLGMLVQIPLFLGVFAAVSRGLSGRGRFLWVKDLTASDPLLACICAILTGVSAFLAPNAHESQRTAFIVLPAALTLVFLWRVSAGVAIYSFSYSLVGVAQSVLIRRHAGKILR
jgi:YidC/Oxa1 family membrane protein insertase